MKKYIQICQRGTKGLVSTAAFCCLSSNLFAIENPFASSQTNLPPSYKGPKFQLSYNYPDSAPVPSMPWRNTLNGAPISLETAHDYAYSLRAAVADDMKVLIGNYSDWNAEERGWYNQPWLSSIREPIHGMFQATTTNTSLFNDPDVTVNYMNDFGAVYYNVTAAPTLKRFWGDTAMQPNLTTSAGQFDEGSLIVKLAYTQIDGSKWPVLKGSPTWQIYAKWVDQQTAQPAADNTFFDIQLLQMDIIVKDSVASPQTGWVFTTLVYDNRIDGDFWDRMIPLGAAWGNDPDVISPATQGYRAPLKETWINPASPKYAQQTLGWGGRLSGPNDQAVQAAGEYIDPNTGKSGTEPVANSACMSCHGPAEWPSQSFLMPGHANSHGYYMAEPGSKYWMRWFQNRLGTEPMDSGSVALDYDMMFSFKALPHWANATNSSLANLTLFKRPSDIIKATTKQPTEIQQRSYNGLLFPHERP